MLDRSQAARYNLSEVKELIALGRVRFCLNRPKNRETLKRLGLDADDALGVIIKLKQNDFAGVDKEEGKQDADVYLKTVQAIRVYVKFRVEKPRNLIVISFHQDEANRGV